MPTTTSYADQIVKRGQRERWSMYRTLVIHRIVLREEGAWIGEAFGSKLIQQDCTKIVLKLARYVTEM